MAVKIGAICLALIASLDAWLTGAASKPRYLIVIPVLAALILGDVPTGGIALADGFRIYKVPSRGMQPSIMEGDRIVADTKYYETRTLKRGETVVVVLPNNTYVETRAGCWRRYDSRLGRSGVAEWPTTSRTLHPVHGGRSRFRAVGIRTDLGGPRKAVLDGRQSRHEP